MNDKTFCSHLIELVRKSAFLKWYTSKYILINVLKDLFEKFIILWENSPSNLYIPFYVFPVKLYSPSSMLLCTQTNSLYRSILGDGR